MTEDADNQNRHVLAGQALDRLEAAAVKNPIRAGPRESMLTGAIDFGGFGSGISLNNSQLSRPGQSQYHTEVQQKPKYQATLDLNEILDDEDEEQSIASHLEHIEQNINNITELVLQFQIIIEEDILNERTLNLTSDNFLTEFLDIHF